MSSRHVDKRIRRAYAKVPRVACKGLCWESCALAPMTRLEKDRIAKRHPTLVPEQSEMSTRAGAPKFALPVVNDKCQALTIDKRCAIYEDRPLICRLYGVAAGMLCPFGCEPESVIPRVRALSLLSELEDEDDE